MAMSNYVLRAKEVCKTFSGVYALNKVNIDIRQGEVHCLAGENGCGKSTLINIISGVYTRDSGEIELNGKVYKKITPAEAIEEGVQVIYQDFAVFPNLTVKENLSISTMVSSHKKIMNWKESEKIAQKAMEMIGVELDMDQEVGEISVADKQLVAICRALINDAKLLIMDEPTTALTKREVKTLFQTVLRLKRQGLSILFVSHKLDEVFEICDRYTILRNGENVLTGSTEKLDNRSFAYYMTGRSFLDVKFTAPKKGKEPLLEVKHLTAEGAFSDVSFTLYPGEILSVVGLLGSGRTELALALFGIQPASSGEIMVKGRKACISKVTDAVGLGIGYVPEDRLTEGLFMKQSIGDNLVISKIEKLAGRLGILNRKKMEAEKTDIMKRMKIKSPSPDYAVSTLSGGNQQRVVLGKWIARNMDVLILNGPTVGVDIGSKYDIHQVMKELADEGMGILMISDDLPEVLAVSNRGIVIKNGRIAGSFETDGTTTEMLDEMIGV